VAVTGLGSAASGRASAYATGCPGFNSLVWVILKTFKMVVMASLQWHSEIMGLRGY